MYFSVQEKNEDNVLRQRVDEGFRRLESIGGELQEKLGKVQDILWQVTVKIRKFKQTKWKLISFSTRPVGFAAGKNFNMKLTTLISDQTVDSVQLLDI